MGQMKNPYDYKERLFDLEVYNKKQMNYYGLLMKSITDLCDNKTIKNIIDRHYQLMKEYDENNQDAK